VDTIIRVVAFSILINWSIAMHIVNQMHEVRRVKFIAASIALIGTSAAALTLLL